MAETPEPRALSAALAAPAFATRGAGVAMHVADRHVERWAPEAGADRVRPLRALGFVDRLISPWIDAAQRSATLRSFAQYATDGFGERAPGAVSWVFPRPWYQDELHWMAAARRAPQAEPAMLTTRGTYVALSSGLSAQAGSSSAGQTAAEARGAVPAALYEYVAPAMSIAAPMAPAGVGQGGAQAVRGDAYSPLISLAAVQAAQLMARAVAPAVAPATASARMSPALRNVLAAMLERAATAPSDEPTRLAMLAPELVTPPAPREPALPAARGAATGGEADVVAEHYAAQRVRLLEAQRVAQRAVEREVAARAAEDAARADAARAARATSTAPRGAALDGAVLESAALDGATAPGDARAAELRAAVQRAEDQLRASAAGKAVEERAQGAAASERQRAEVERAAASASATERQRVEVERAAASVSATERQRAEVERATASASATERQRAEVERAAASASATERQRAEVERAAATATERRRSADALAAAEQQRLEGAAAAAAARAEPTAAAGRPAELLRGDAAIASGRGALERAVAQALEQQQRVAERAGAQRLHEQARFEAAAHARAAVPAEPARPLAPAGQVERPGARPSAEVLAAIAGLPPELAAVVGARPERAVQAMQELEVSLRTIELLARSEASGAAFQATRGPRLVMPVGLGGLVAAVDRAHAMPTSRGGSGAMALLAAATPSSALGADAVGLEPGVGAAQGAAERSGAARPVGAARVPTLAWLALAGQAPTSFDAPSAGGAGSAGAANALTSIAGPVVAMGRVGALGAAAAAPPAALGHVAWADRWLARFAGASRASLDTLAAAGASTHWEALAAAAPGGVFVAPALDVERGASARDPSRRVEWAGSSSSTAAASGGPSAGSSDRRVAAAPGPTPMPVLRFADDAETPDDVFAAISASVAQQRTRVDATPPPAAAASPAVAWQLEGSPADRIASTAPAAAHAGLASALASSPFAVALRHVLPLPAAAPFDVRSLFSAGLSATYLAGLLAEDAPELAVAAMLPRWASGLAAREIPGDAERSDADAGALNELAARERSVPGWDAAYVAPAAIDPERARATAELVTQLAALSGSTPSAAAAALTAVIPVGAPITAVAIEAAAHALLASTSGSASAPDSTAAARASAQDPAVQVAAAQIAAAQDPAVQVAAAQVAAEHAAAAQVAAAQDAAAQDAAAAQAIADQIAAAAQVAHGAAAQAAAAAAQPGPGAPFEATGAMVDAGGLTADSSALAAAIAATLSASLPPGLVLAAAAEVTAAVLGAAPASVAGAAGVGGPGAIAAPRALAAAFAPADAGPALTALRPSLLAWGGDAQIDAGGATTSASVFASSLTSFAGEPLTGESPDSVALAPWAAWIASTPGTAGMPLLTARAMLESMALPMLGDVGAPAAPAWMAPGAVATRAHGWAVAQERSASDLAFDFVSPELVLAARVYGLGPAEAAQAARLAIAGSGHLTAMAGTVDRTFLQAMAMDAERRERIATLYPALAGPSAAGAASLSTRAPAIPALALGEAAASGRALIGSEAATRGGPLADGALADGAAVPSVELARAQAVAAEARAAAQEATAELGRIAALGAIPAGESPASAEAPQSAGAPPRSTPAGMAFGIDRRWPRGAFLWPSASVAALGLGAAGPEGDQAMSVAALELLAARAVAELGTFAALRDPDTDVAALLAAGGPDALSGRGDPVARTGAPLLSPAFASGASGAPGLTWALPAGGAPAPATGSVGGLVTGASTTGSAGAAAAAASESVREPSERDVLDTAGVLVPAARRARFEALYLALGQSPAGRSWSPAARAARALALAGGSEGGPTSAHERAAAAWDVLPVVYAAEGLFDRGPEGSAAAPAGSPTIAHGIGSAGASYRGAISGGGSSWVAGVGGILASGIGGFAVGGGAVGEGPSLRDAPSADYVTAGFAGEGLSGLSARAGEALGAYVAPSSGLAGGSTAGPSSASAGGRDPGDLGAVRRAPTAAQELVRTGRPAGRHGGGEVEIPPWFEAAARKMFESEGSSPSDGISLAELTLVTAAPASQIAASSRAAASPTPSTPSGSGGGGGADSSATGNNIDIESTALDIYKRILDMMDNERARSGEPYL